MIVSIGQISWKFLYNSFSEPMFLPSIWSPCINIELTNKMADWIGTKPNFNSALCWFKRHVLLKPKASFKLYKPFINCIFFVRFVFCWKCLLSLSISGRIWCSLSCPLWPRGTAVVASLKCRYSFIFRYWLRVMVSLTFLTWRYLFLDQKCRSEGKVLVPWSIRIPKYARMSVPFTGVQFWSCLPAALCFCSAFRFVSFTINSIKSSGGRIFVGPVSFSKLFTWTFRKLRLHVSSSGNSSSDSSPLSSSLLSLNDISLSQGFQ